MLDESARPLEFGDVAEDVLDDEIQIEIAAIDTRIARSTAAEVARSKPAGKGQLEHADQALDDPVASRIAGGFKQLR